MRISSFCFKFDLKPIQIKIPMKIKFTFALLSLFILASCGSSQQVISNDGQVYTVKGKKVYKNDVEVTDSMTASEKSNVFNTIDKREKAEKELKEQQEKLEKEQRRLEKAQKEAKEKQEQLEKEIKEKARARENYLDAKKDLADERKTYERRLKKGKLSPNDIEDWEVKFKKLEKKIIDLERDYNRLK
jgi:DNA repair exonuclease SbcCD ATPase subunit